MSGRRQAAAALYALAEADRSLILAELPEEDQASLRGHLAELRTLGFEAAPMAGLAPKAPLELASATAAAIHGLLEHEPAALVAQLLAVQKWRWRDELLALFPAARRDSILAVQVTPAPARTRFLLESLSRRLAQAAPAAPARGRLAPLAVIAPLLRRMTSWQR